MQEILETTESFITGLQNQNKKDINNAIFIAKELFCLYLPLKEFRGAGRHGVKNLELYRILESIDLASENRENQKAFNLGKILSDCNSREMMLMASYLWNEGRSNLSETEKKEALTLLKDKFPDVCTKFTPDEERRYHPCAKCKSSTDSYFNFIGSYDTYKCPYCDLTFNVEIPD